MEFQAKAFWADSAHLPSASKAVVVDVAARLCAALRDFRKVRADGEADAALAAVADDAPGHGRSLNASASKHVWPSRVIHYVQRRILHAEIQGGQLLPAPTLASLTESAQRAPTLRFTRLLTADS